MFSPLRTTVFASAVLVVATCSKAEPESLPPIFVPKIEAAIASPSKEPSRHSEVSGSLRRLITEKVLADAKGASALTPQARGVSAPISPDSETLLMDRVTVRAPALPVLKLPEHTYPLQDFFERGVFYRSRDGRMDGAVNLARFYSSRVGSGGAETKAEITFNFHW